MTEYINLLISANWAEALTRPFTDLIGGWFWVILILGFATVIQFKTQSPEATGLTIFFLGALGAFSNLPGVTESANINMIALFGFLAIFGLAITIWKPFKRGI